MKGDFSRDAFDPRKNFTRVMMQQGRPQLDADWNEQVGIFWESWRNLISDVVGPHAGPERDCGFGILSLADFPLPAEAGVSQQEQEHWQHLLRGAGDFLIGVGHYYVDGVRSSNARMITYLTQPGLPNCPPLENKPRHHYLIYLDVWERHISHLEDDSIREVALLGADTTTRAKLVWQVRSFDLNVAENVELNNIDNSMVREKWHSLVHHWQANHRGRLRARAEAASDTPSIEPSLVSPASRFRGFANQLYRVEIHNGGNIASGDTPTFKFSRENGSVIFPIQELDGPVVTLANLGRDVYSSLAKGDWVEIVDDDYGLENRAEPLRQVEQVDSSNMRVTLKGQPASAVGTDSAKHPLLRRWDHKHGDPKKGGLELENGAAVIKEVDEDKFWLTLENGVQVQFEKSQEQPHYRTGDYWLIPARIATGDVLWPFHNNNPEAIGPHGVQHHYAPLAIVSFRKEVLETLCDCRLKFGLQTSY